MSGYLTVRDVAARLNVTADTVRNYCKSGKLPCIRPGGKEFRIPADGLDTFEADARTAEEERLRIAARASLDEAIAAGRLPAEVPPEVIGRIAQILRQHYVDQGARTAS